MRITEIILENQSPALPPILYHGTSRKNLHAIMKDGLKPKLNKWLYLNKHQRQHPNYPGYMPPTPEEKARDTVVSTTTSINHAKGYAEMGGSTGRRTPETVRDAVVLAFKPLPTDKIGVEKGYDADIVFYNTITPDRLQIVYPERLIGKEQYFIGKGEVLTDFNAEKSAKMKEINKQLKAAGSLARIKSYKYAKPRWDVFADPRPNDWPGTLATGGVVDMTSPEFQTWLTSQHK